MSVIIRIQAYWEILVRPSTSSVTGDEDSKGDKIKESVVSHNRNLTKKKTLW